MGFKQNKVRAWRGLGRFAVFRTVRQCSLVRV